MRSSGLQTPSGEKEVIFSVWSEWLLAASHPLCVMSCKLGRPWKLCKHVRLSEWGQWNVSTSGGKVNKTQEMRGKVLPVYCGCREENPPRTSLDAFDAICYALPGTVKKSRKINNLFFGILPVSHCSSSFSLSVTLSFLSFPLPLFRSHLSRRTWGQFLRVPAEGLAHVRQDGYRSPQDLWWCHRGTVQSRNVSACVVRFPRMPAAHYFNTVFITWRS